MTHQCPNCGSLCGCWQGDDSCASESRDICTHDCDKEIDEEEDEIEYEIKCPLNYSYDINPEFTERMESFDDMIQKNCFVISHCKFYKEK